MLFPSISVAVGSLATGWILRHTKMKLSHCAYWIVTIGMSIQLLGLVVAYYLIQNLEPSLSGSAIFGAFVQIGQNISSQSYTWVVIYALALILVSFGYACLLVATLVNIVFTIPKSQQGTVTGIFYLWRSIGNVLGASLTLVFYEKGVSSFLWNYMFNKQHDDYNFSKKNTGNSFQIQAILGQDISQMEYCSSYLRYTGIPSYYHIYQTLYWQ